MLVAMGSVEKTSRGKGGLGKVGDTTRTAWGRQLEALSFQESSARPRPEAWAGSGQV